MAYDRYDTRRDPRERWRSDERFNRERGQRDADERGFFERAGDEIASWFSDEDDRRDRDYRRDERGDFARGRGAQEFRDREPPRALGNDGRWDRGEGRHGRWREPAEERGYRPMAGDYGRSERQFDRGDRRPTGAGGSSDRPGLHDPHYAEWRRRQLDELDRDYDEYRREHQSRFESEFGDWRSRRQTKRQMLGSVREQMEVVGSNEEHVGTVDRVAGDRIILTKSDEAAGGVHHSIPCTMVDRIEDQRVILDCDAEQAKQKWRDDSRERALFEPEDQGEAGPHILDRSFSGTYR